MRVAAAKRVNCCRLFCCFVCLFVFCLSPDVTKPVFISLLNKKCEDLCNESEMYSSTLWCIFVVTEIWYMDIRIRILYWFVGLKNNNNFTTRESQVSAQAITIKECFLHYNRQPRYWSHGKARSIIWLCLTLFMEPTFVNWILLFKNICSVILTPLINIEAFPGKFWWQRGMLGNMLPVPPDIDLCCSSKIVASSGCSYIRIGQHAERVNFNGPRLLCPDVNDATRNLFSESLIKSLPHII